MDTHLKLYATQLKQLTQTHTHTHPLHDLNAYLNLPRNKKATVFHNNEHTNIIISEPDITPEECRENLKYIHITITSQYLSSRKNNKVTSTTLYDIYSSEQTLLHHMSTKLEQSQQITTLEKLPTYSEPLNFHATMCTMLVTYMTLIITLTVVNYQQTQHHQSVEKAFRSIRGNPRVGI